LHKIGYYSANFKIKVGNNTNEANVGVITKGDVGQKTNIGSNPFNPKTNITFDLPKDIDIRLTVYDVLGREVYNINELRKAGSNRVEFDGTNLASGVYYYSLEVGTFAETKKMVLIK